MKLGDAGSHQTALSITACVIGVITLLSALGVNSLWSRDEVIGVVFLSLIAAVCGGLSLFHQKPSKSTAVIGLVLAGMSLLICVGNL